MSADPHGAGAEAWAAAIDGGWGDHLLPVVCDPGALISAKSKLQSIGKLPSQFDASGLVVGVPGWPARPTTPQDLTRWRGGPDYGFCVRTGGARDGSDPEHFGGACLALDVDVDDKARAQQIIARAIDLLGPAPMRVRSNSPRAVLLYRIVGRVPKRRFLVQGLDKAAVELLGDGQQVLLAGRHPSGAHYEVIDADGMPALPALADVPVLTLDRLNAAWGALRDEFAVVGSEERAGVGARAAPRFKRDIADPFLDALYAVGAVLDDAPDGKVFVECPNVASHSSDNGPSQTAYLARGLGGIGARAVHCMHAGCAGRPLLRELAELHGLSAELDAVLSAEGRGPASADEFPDESAGAGGAVANAAETASLPAFERDPKGRVLPTTKNLRLALAVPRLCGARIATDRFLGQLMFASEDAEAWEPFNDGHYVELRCALTDRLGMKDAPKELLRDVVRWVGEHHAFDSATEWAHSLRWDGTPRIETTLIDYFGVPDTPYARAVALYLWTALGGRCLEPGVKADMVPVLIGKQGAGKTTAVEALAPTEETFVEVNLERKDDDVARSMRGKLVGEIAELRGLQGRDAEAIKAWLTRRHEEWTPKYQEFGTRFARRLLFVGTTNRSEFLDDDTGERRWLPVEVGNVDVPGLRAVCDQLWAEGIARYSAEGVLWQDAQRLAAGVHDGHKIGDAWGQIIAGWLEADDAAGGVNGDAPFLRGHDILRGALGIPPERITRAVEMRLGKAMRRLGFANPRLRKDGFRFRAWVRENPEELA